MSNQAASSSSQPPRPFTRSQAQSEDEDLAANQQQIMITQENLSIIIANAVAAAMQNMPPTPTSVDSRQARGDASGDQPNTKITVTPLDFTDDSFHTWREHVKLYYKGTGM